MTGGVHSNYRYREPHPIYFSHAKGAYVWDIDGNKYVDCNCNMGTCILGHAHPKVIRAVRRQLESGLTNGLESQLSIRVAERLHDMIPCAEIVKFCNTGTEAVMHAVQIARSCSGKDRIAKLEGGYDGTYDDVFVSTHPTLEDAGPADNPANVPSTSGLGECSKKTVIVPFNNIEDTTRIIREHRDELAAIIMEPVMFNAGCVLPDLEYLKAMRELTNDLDIILIFDEIITGFRMAPGGAQEYYGIVPDMSTLAKAIANGFPLAAVVGKREIMNVTDPKTGKSTFNGTYNGHQISLAAADATLAELKTGRIQRQLHDASDWLGKHFEETASKVGASAVMQGIAGKFQVYFVNEKPHDYRAAMSADSEKYAAYYKSMLEAGILINRPTTSHQGLTSAHTRNDLDAIITGMKKALESSKR